MTKGLGKLELIWRLELELRHGAKYRVQSWAPDLAFWEIVGHCCCYCVVYDMWIYYLDTPDAALAMLRPSEGGFVPSHGMRWVGVAWKCFCVLAIGLNSIQYRLM